MFELLAMMAIGMFAGGALGAAKAPKIQPPEKPPQAAKKHDRAAMLGANAAMAGPGGPMSGNRGTFLTGPSGVDSSSLNLGKNTLLGE